MSCVFALLLTALGYAISWVITVGLIKLITICFGWTFSLLIASGIWLVLCILSSFFKK